MHSYSPRHRRLRNFLGREMTRWLLLFVLVIFVSACNRTEPEPDPVTPAVQVAGIGQSTGAAPAQTATSSTPATVAPTPTPEPITGTIEIWHSWALKEGDALAEILAAFSATYPGIQVETLFVANSDLLQSYADAVISGGGPDILIAPNWWLGGMADAGVVAPLTPESRQELDRFWPAAAESMHWQDDYYGLPIHVTVVALFYNRALLGETPLPQTATELLNLASTSPELGIGLYANLYHLFWGFPAFGSTLFNEAGKVILDQDNGAADYLTWLVQLDQTPGAFVDTDYGMLLDRFKKQEFAFLVDGPWSIDDLRGALGANLGAAVLPAGPAGPARPWLYADAIYFNPNSPAVRAGLAHLFAHFAVSPESGTALANTASLLPANRFTRPVEDPVSQAFMRQAASAQAMPLRREMNHVWGYGGDMIIKAINTVDSPSAIVAETVSLINEANAR
jgi:arabinogalactan oligomer / maltooligosaccharide transport system substrate-binding protein